jgi:hypothetical protein
LEKWSPNALARLFFSQYFGILRRNAPRRAHNVIKIFKRMPQNRTPGFGRRIVGIDGVVYLPKKKKAHTPH